MMWGTTWVQRIRLAPIYLAMNAADRIGRIKYRRKPLAMPPWREGVSVIIPDRDAPGMLTEALESLYRALKPVDEPHQVIVVANGAPIDHYASVRVQFPQVEFV